tara:strand:+ start:697 stop:1032 length:336 start_codon:yes stop_codon:yes gene_type:complete
MVSDRVQNWSIVRYGREAAGGGVFTGYQAIPGADVANTYNLAPLNVTVAFIEKSGGQVVVKGSNQFRGLHIDEVVDSFNGGEVTPDEALRFCFDYLRDMLGEKDNYFIHEL